MTLFTREMIERTMIHPTRPVEICAASHCRHLIFTYRQRCLRQINKWYHWGCLFDERKAT